MKFLKFGRIAKFQNQPFIQNFLLHVSTLSVHLQVEMNEDESSQRKQEMKSNGNW